MHFLDPFTTPWRRDVAECLARPEFYDGAERSFLALAENATEASLVVRTRIRDLHSRLARDAQARARRSRVTSAGKTAVSGRR